MTELSPNKVYDCGWRGERELDAPLYKISGQSPNNHHHALESVHKSLNRNF
jgi:hypothetical protein